MRNGNRHRIADFTVVAALSLVFITFAVAAAQQARLANARVACASNLNRIALAMIMYGNGERNQSFPRTQFKPDDPPRFFTHWNQPKSFGNGAPDANDVTAALYLAVKTQEVDPKVLHCPESKAKPLVFGSQPGAVAKSAKDISNLPGMDFVSYSFQNPYPSGDAMLKGFRWNVTLGSDFAVAADLNPGEAAGKLQAPRYVPPDTQPTTVSTTQPGRAPVRATPASAAPVPTPPGNTPNHGRAGQNVAYADGHVEWQVTPFAGPKLGSGANLWRDNIYTARTAPDQRTGGNILAAPFDSDDNILLPAADYKGH